MSRRSSTPKSPKVKPPSAKELRIKVEELNEECERLRTQNDDLQTKYKLICKKIVDNIDLSEYAFIEPDTEPHLIDIRDLFHMVQKVLRK